MPREPINVVDPSAPDYMSRQVETSRLFWFDLDPGDANELRVISAGYEACRADFRIDRKEFPWSCFEFVLDGCGVLELGGRELALGPDTCFLYGPGIEHHIRSDRDKPLKKYFVVFAGLEGERLCERIGMPPGTVSESTNGLSMKRALDELIERGSRRTDLAHPLCAALLQQVLLMARADAIEAGVADTKAFATYRRVRDFIADHYLEVTSLEGVASACQLDAAYLCRLFTRFQDERPYQHLTRLRMEHAAGRLLDADLPVKQVAKEMGFSDAFHFSRVFKSVHRVPPSRFKRGGPLSGGS